MAANVNLSNTDLGGLTLPPGVYKFSAAAALHGALTLDARGQNHAFWIFQIGTQLTTAINSSVTVINPGSNGGSDDGIFWDAGSAIVIGANNQIEGNYLAGTSITFGISSQGAGRALALAEVSLDDNVINSHGGPAGSDWTGGLTQSLSGQAVPIIQLLPSSFLPMITTQPESAVIKAGANVKFHVVASGPGLLTYAWEKNKVMLKNGIRVYQATTATLILRRVVFTDAGNYRVVVTNPQGSVTSRSVKLIVKPSRS
jgi:hypothetical protein